MRRRAPGRRPPLATHRPRTRLPAGGIYQLRITFPDQYPSKPPRVRFISEMFHPNIFGDGSLCLDILQDKWKPVYTVGSILTSIQVRRGARAGGCCSSGPRRPLHRFRGTS